VPRLVLNLAYLTPGATGGMETVARAFVPALARVLPEGWDVVALVGRAASADPTGPWNRLATRTLPLDATQRVRWLDAEQTLVPLLARRAGGDVLHSLGNIGPLRAPLPHVATVNDLTLHVTEGDAASLKTRLLRGAVSATARHADVVSCPSTQTVVDLERLTGLPRARTRMIPYGIDTPTVAAAPEAEVRDRLGLGDRELVLSPSSRLPHKNLPRLLRAHALLPAPRPLLVMPGYPTAHDDDLAREALALGVADDVLWPGWVEQADLEALYRASRLLVFPSLYEGFGLPVLEAMLRGLPVACSGRGSLAEIAGDAAVLFDAEDPASIAAAVTRLLSDDALRDRLVAAGRERAAGYTWERCAADHVTVYGELLAGRRRG
jgi:glycosyltransferase involved in cell wall biosynthesis